MHDYHVHSNYSDGEFLRTMIRAAADAGLEGVGIADHCSVSADPEAQRARRALGFNLDLTHERRREAITELRKTTDIDVYAAVEMDYHPNDEDAIRSFLDDARFEYAVGSVHDLDGTNVHFRDHFAEKSASERRALVDRYVEKLVALIDSELFDIAAHPDLVERNPHLRGFITADHYDRVAEAFGRSHTVPELNAGRVLDDYGVFHPAPAFLDVLVERDLSVTVGTDSHTPDVIEPRVTAIERELTERGIDPVRIVE